MNLEKLKQDAREKLELKSEVINDTLWYVNPNDLDEIVTSTYLQAVEDIKESYGWMNDGCGCCMEKDLETYLDEELQSLKQIKE